MLRHQRNETESATIGGYSPVARRDVMTDAHIEDFLDHRFAPLIGTISYEERQERRAEMRQQILSLAAAHEELGSTRGEAIAYAVNSLATPMPVTVQRVVTTEATRAEASTGWLSLPVALFSFGVSAAASLLLTYAFRQATGNTMLGFMTLVLGVFPFMAGSFLSSKQARMPVQGLIMAQLILYAPITACFYHMIAAEGSPGPLREIAVVTAAYSAISTLFGVTGVHAGRWLKRKASRLLGKDGGE